MSNIARYREIAEWQSRNPILNNGEPGFEEETGKLKIGDGVTHWLDLPYIDVAPYTLPPEVIRSMTVADFGLIVPHGVRAYANSTSQVITNGAYPVYLDLNALEYNENPDFYDVDFTGNRITVAEGGQYLISWDVSFVNSSALREAYIAKNGGNAILSAAAGAGGQAGRTAPIRLAADDYVQIICYVEGSDIALFTNAPHRCGLALHRIAL